MHLSIEAVELIRPVESQPWDASLQAEQNGLKAHVFRPEPYGFFISHRMRSSHPLPAIR